MSNIKCLHDLAEKETACADGCCPICLAKELDKQTASMEKDVLDALIEKAKEGLDSNSHEEVWLHKDILKWLKQLRDGE